MHARNTVKDCLKVTAKRKHSKVKERVDWVLNILTLLVNCLFALNDFCQYFLYIICHIVCLITNLFQCKKLFPNWQTDFISSPGVKRLFTWTKLTFLSFEWIEHLVVLKTFSKVMNTNFWSLMFKVQKVSYLVEIFKSILYWFWYCI